MITTLLKAIVFDCIEQIFENNPIKLSLDCIKIVIINPKLFSNRPLDRKHSQLCKSASWCIVVWIQGIVKWLRLRQWNRRFCLARIRAGVLLARFTSRSKKFYRDPGTIYARVYQVSSPYDRSSSGYDVEDRFREVHRPPSFG